MKRYIALSRYSVMLPQK